MNMREAFEEYAEGYCYYLDKDSDGKYKNPATALAWQIWKAAKKSPPLDFSRSQIGNREAEEVIRTMWANGMESEAQSLADCFYGLVDANAALASQAQQEPVSNLNCEDISLIRQWFNAVQDLNPKYLNEGDFQLLAKLQSQAQQPCDMNELCLDCQPRGKNGECPDQLPPAPEGGGK